MYNKQKNKINEEKANNIPNKLEEKNKKEQNKKEQNKEEKKSLFKSNFKLFIYSGLFILLMIFSLFYASNLEESLLANGFLENSSLFFIALIIGLLDGFNPCAMWVLIYLITLVSELKDKKKMWLIAGTFLLASGIVYFIILSLYLAGWELIKLVGLTAIILKLAGLFAIGTGIWFLYDFYKSGGQVVCKVGDIQKKKKTMNKIKEIVQSPFSFPIFLSLLLLAFSVNLTEFFCSIGLPQVFTGLLSSANLSGGMQLFYILVYILAFMADDLLIFYLALKTMESPVMDKYAGLVKLIGGLLMLVLGIVILFFPQFFV